MLQVRNMAASEELDLHVYTSWQFQGHQFVYRVRFKLLDVYEALMCPSLKLLSGVLVDMWGRQNGVLADAGRQWHRPCDLSTCRWHSVSISC